MPLANDSPPRNLPCVFVFIALHVVGLEISPVWAGLVMCGDMVMVLNMSSHVSLSWFEGGSCSGDLNKCDLKSSP